jgi:hypothetical protein
MSTCFINCGIGEWYCHGSDRLKASLIAHNFQGDIFIWKDWPELPFPRDTIYNCKVAAFQQVIDAGYTTIIWADSSIYAQADVTPFVESVTKEGLWIGQSGYNAAQTCSDACLKYFGVTRDQAEKMPDTATGLFGVNIKFPFAREFIETWIKAGREGAFNGSRLHAKQSRDSRFKFHRQDQSAATMILGKNMISLAEFSEFCGFRWDSYPSIFKCEGM